MHNVPGRMNSQQTLEFLQDAKEGNRSAFAAIVRSHQHLAYGAAYRLLLDVHEAEDVVQETFVRIWRNLYRYDPAKAFTTWMYSIVMNLCRDRLRERRRRPSQALEPSEMEHLPGAQASGVGAEEWELAGIIGRLAEQLPLKQRLVFTLRDLQDLSVEEVASVVGISAASVKTNLHHARRKLRGLLAREYKITGVDS